MNTNEAIILHVAIFSAVISLTGCYEPAMVPREDLKRALAEKSQVEATATSTWRELQKAQQTISLQQQEKAQLESQVVGFYKKLRDQEEERQQVQERFKDAEHIIARQETMTARAERGLSFWRVGAAFLFVLSVVLLFIGAAAGSATRKEVQREAA